MVRSEGQFGQKAGNISKQNVIIIKRGYHVRSIAIHPWVIAGGICLSILFGAIYLSATAYLIFRDDLIFASYSRQSQMREAYEDRIASLRSRIDRISSRQLLNEHAFEDRLDTLLQRQQTLDGRQDLIAKVIKKARAQGLKVATGLPRPKPVIDPQRSATPVGADVAPTTTGSIAPTESNGKQAEVIGDFNRIEKDLTKIAMHQAAALDVIAASVEKDIARAKKVVSRLGVRLKSFESAAKAQGGPYVPVEGDDVFKDRVNRAFIAITRLQKVKDALSALPLRSPLAGKAKMTSRYGRRLDPFLRRPAMHTGVDYKAGYGRPIRATGPGKVAFAGRKGGYGRVVIIDHGNGLSSRYAHMSRYKVKKGQKVKAGQTIGLVGSSGRSTGPHLHYELRVNKTHVNPLAYLSAGRELRNLY